MEDEAEVRLAPYGPDWHLSPRPNRIVSEEVVHTLCRCEVVAGATHQDLKRETPVIAHQCLDGVEVEHELRAHSGLSAAGADAQLVARASEGTAAPAGWWPLLSRLVPPLS